ncbi:p-loop containing nucleoside triphosphate hydrolase protein [Favolaschia claudopus]|uniref:P-loop containing nucleoside triphosphate hydrolase protein n=1 Tax=Favolaschia claudopus TaxID=2862362 RepID=A0AAW0DJL5_9AGAR
MRSKPAGKDPTHHYIEAADRLKRSGARLGRTSTGSARSAGQLEQQLRDGIQPVVTPSAADLEDAKRRFGYREGLHHFAVAGVAGSGKSSLINGLRGLRNKDPGGRCNGDHRDDVVHSLTDIAILRNARSRATLEFTCKEHFVSATRQNVRENLRRAELSEKRVYIVSNLTMLSVAKGNPTTKMARGLSMNLSYLKICFKSQSMLDVDLPPELPEGYAVFMGA